MTKYDAFVKDVEETNKSYGLPTEQGKLYMLTAIATSLTQIVDALEEKNKEEPEVEERKTGKWRDTGSGQECSCCGEVQYGYDNIRRFCAWCGAKMEVDE